MFRSGCRCFGSGCFIYPITTKAVYATGLIIGTPIARRQKLFKTSSSKKSLITKAKANF
jgi:hypothetical protein